ncbi:hypothetical protein CVT25_009836 [Psilocybe cyanescens]|uniref:Uncharacterized protein n=1 Tax=Psilocybe cyanescens TaxID=93625 RepID=A0A409X828_PSICY|nr:hypothetical protein CVT25_009836 [Psilocybe cyanescens]
MNGSFAYVNINFEIQIWELLTKGSKRLLSPGEPSQESCKNTRCPPTSSIKYSVFQTPEIETLVEPRRTISQDLQEYSLFSDTIFQTPHEGLETLIEPRRTTLEELQEYSLSSDIIK